MRLVGLYEAENHEAQQAHYGKLQHLTRVMKSGRLEYGVQKVAIDPI